MPTVVGIPIPAPSGENATGDEAMARNMQREMEQAAAARAMKRADQQFKDEELARNFAFLEAARLASAGRGASPTGGQTGRTRCCPAAECARRVKNNRKNIEMGEATDGRNKCHCRDSQNQEPRRNTSKIISKMLQPWSPTWFRTLAATLAPTRFPETINAKSK